MSTKAKKTFRALAENITFVVQHVPYPHGDLITAPFLPMPSQCNSTTFLRVFEVDDFHDRSQQQISFTFRKLE